MTPDTRVDMVDMAEFQACFGPEPTAACLAAFDDNQSGTIDLADYEAMRGRWTGP